MTNTVEVVIIGHGEKVPAKYENLQPTMVHRNSGGKLELWYLVTDLKRVH
jgi:hypothetical protein